MRIKDGLIDAVKHVTLGLDPIIAVGLKPMYRFVLVSSLDGHQLAVGLDGHRIAIARSLDDMHHPLDSHLVDPTIRFPPVHAVDLQNNFSDAVFGIHWWYLVQALTFARSDLVRLILRTPGDAATEVISEDNDMQLTSVIMPMQLGEWADDIISGIK